MTATPLPRMIQQPAAADLAFLVTSSATVTQILKDLGVEGEWNKLVCIVVSMVLGYILLFEPAVWSVFIIPLAGANATGGVSLLFDFAKKLAAMLRGQRAA